MKSDTCGSEVQEEPQQQLQDPMRRVTRSTSEQAVQVTCLQENVQRPLFDVGVRCNRLLLTLETKSMENLDRFYTIIRPLTGICSKSSGPKPPKLLRNSESFCRQFMRVKNSRTKSVCDSALKRINHSPSADSQPDLGEASFDALKQALSSGPLLRTFYPNRRAVQTRTQAALRLR